MIATDFCPSLFLWKLAMLDKKKVLLQIDTDVHASSFDSIVAIDAGVDVVLPFAEVDVDNVVDLIHGAMFTRGHADLCRTAAFFGGSQIALAEQLFAQCKAAFFGPVRVSMMLDPNGANTTAAAAVRCVERHLSLANRKVAIFGGSGPVGSRLAILASKLGAQVQLCSRSRERAKETIEQISGQAKREFLTAVEVPSDKEALAVAQTTDIIFAAGAAGVQFLPDGWQDQAESVAVAIDINAVPPVGLAGIEVMDSGVKRGNDTICYGAIGVGGLKMRIHKACIKALFETNNKLFGNHEIHEIAMHF
jgi:methylenetetrahydrofolate/methylenetetrahydromethanopterin dehydrogenase (NADP+)